jgi:iron complex outermembrane recepter protein
MTTRIQKRKYGNPAAVVRGTAITCLSSIFSFAASAQTEPQTPPAATSTPQKIEKIEITGSRIKRSADNEGPTSVEIITREEIERRGATSVTDVLRNLGAQSGLSYDERNTSVVNGAASSSLRGLAPNATLILINGRRVAYNGFSSVFGLTSETFVDLNSLPLGAVDRIEILKDSASAIYGSDAVAGVINVILRRDFRGVEVSAQIGTATGGADEQKISLSGGLGDVARDKFNALFTIDISRRDPLFARDRDYSLAAGRQLASTVTTANLQNSPGNALGFARPINNTTNCSSGIAIGPSSQTLGSTFCGYNSNTQATLIPEEERQQLFGRAVYQPSERFSLYGEVGYSQVKTGYDLTSASNTISALAANSPANPFGQSMRVFYRFLDLGPRKFEAENKSTRVIAGTKGSFGVHDWDVAVGHAETKSEQTARNLVNRTTWLNAVNAGSFNLFQANSAASLDAIRAEASRAGKATTDFIDAKISGETPFKLHSPIGYAIGVEHRREQQSDSPSPILQSGQLLGFATTNLPFSTKRNVTSGYGEINLPITSTLEAQLAVRSERYSDFGSSTNPKFGLRFQPVSFLALRASGGTSFRAPSLLEANYPVSTAAGGIFDTTRCRALGISTAACPLTTVELSLGSAAGIGPEKARNYTLGVVLSPTKQSSIAIDYVSIVYKDKIGLNLSTVFPADGVVNEQFVRRGAPAPGDAAGIPPPITNVSLVFDNVYGESRYSGVDFVAEQRVTIPGGTLSIEATGTYLDSFKQSTVKGGPLSNLTGGFSYPRLRGSIASTMSLAKWAGTLRVNHIGGYRDDVNNVGIQSRVGVDMTVDAQLEYTGFVGWKFALGARNLLDREPPYSSQFSQGFNITLSSPRGRFVYGKVSYRF